MEHLSQQTKPVNVLVVGSGGREHALAWKIQKSPMLGNLYVAPGNGGTQPFNVPVAANDLPGLVNFAKKHYCLTIVGPEAPLAEGIVDRFDSENLPIFGPSIEQAKLETSKSFAKEFMRRKEIPTADFKTFEKVKPAVDYANQMNGNVVVKADGLAGGKGVFVCNSVSETEFAIKSILGDRVFGSAGDKVVIEQKLQGREVSLMSICDGNDAVPFGTAVDHKRAFDGDRGPNTGGMGAYSPALGFENESIEGVMESIVKPTVRASGFRGFLYTSLMLSPEKEEPRVLEFNARLGDPETEVILPRLESDLLFLVSAILGGSSVSDMEIKWNHDACCGVVMCSEGYPHKPISGYQIRGIGVGQSLNDVLIFHAATVRQGENFFTNGGRVLCVVGRGESHASATRRAYEAVDLVSWRGEHHRGDICSSERRVFQAEKLA